MNTSISAQGFTLDKDQHELINKKLERINYAENLIVDLIIHVKEDKKFYFDTTVIVNDKEQAIALGKANGQSPFLTSIPVTKSAFNFKS